MATMDWSPLVQSIQSLTQQRGQQLQFNQLLDNLPIGPQTDLFRKLPPQIGMPLLLQTIQSQMAPPADYTLHEGDVRYRGGQPIAAVPKQATALKYDVVNGIPGWIDPAKGFVPDPNAPKRDVPRKYDTVNGVGGWIDPEKGFIPDPNAPKRIPGEGQQETWNNPVDEAGPDGKPIRVQYSNKLGRRVVEGATPKPTNRALPSKVVNDLNLAGTAVDAWDRLYGSFKDSYGGQALYGGIANTLGRTFGDSTGQAQWWQDYQGFINPERNRIFGSALTTQEKAEWEKAMISPGMAPSQIRTNLARQAALAKKAAMRKAEPYIKSNYDKEAIEGALGFSVDTLNPSDGPNNGGDAPPGVDPELWKLATPEERALWK